jgi:hypothetical protein
VLGGRVHGLGDADVGADGGAEEVERPEGGDDAQIEFASYLKYEMGRCGGGGGGGGEEAHP